MLHRRYRVWATDTVVTLQVQSSVISYYFSSVQLPSICSRHFTVVHISSRTEQSIELGRQTTEKDE